MKKAIQITLLAQMALAAAVNVGAKPQKVNAAKTAINQQGQTELQKKLAQARVKQQKAEQRLAAAQKQAADLEKQSAALIDKLSPTGEQAQIKKALQEVQKARAEVNQLSAELLDLQNRQASLWSKVNQLRDQLANKKGEIKLAQGNLSYVQRSILDEPENSAVKHDYYDIKNEIDIRLSETEQQKQSLATFQNRKSRYAKQEAELKAQIKQAEEQIELLKKKEESEKENQALEKAQQELADLKEQSAELAKKQKRNQASINMANTRLTTLPSVIERFNKQMVVLQSKVDKLLQANEEACTYQKQYQAKQAEYQAIEDKISAHENEAGQNQKILPAKQTAQQEAQKELTDKEKAFAAAINQSNQQDSLINKIKKVSADLKKTRQEEKLAAESAQEAAQELAALEKQQTSETEKEKDKDKEDQEKDKQEEETKDEDVEKKEEDKKEEESQEQEEDKKESEDEETEEVADKDKHEEDSQTVTIDVKSNVSVETKAPAEKMMAIAFINKKCALYNGHGQLAGQEFAGNTHWLVSARKKSAGQVFYLVGRDVWLKADDVILENVKTGVARVVNDGANLVTGQGEHTSRLLAKNTLWRVFAEKEIGGQQYYRLGSDQQWILASLVDFK